MINVLCAHQNSVESDLKEAVLDSIIDEVKTQDLVRSKNNACRGANTSYY